MIPTWVLSALIMIVGCILACFIGSALPDYDYFGWYIVIGAVVFTIAAITNDFPLLLAVGMWLPVALPIPGFKNFPTMGVVLGWIALMLFFRLCLTGTARYVKSFNLYFLISFAWVPIRFLMNPVYKLGGNVEGGSGVSGATPYFYYAVAAVLLVVLGGILNTREKVVAFMRWSFAFVFLIGIIFLACAFIPASGPILYSMGIFAAGSLGDGIIRLVQLPAYGFFILQCALCPNLFKFKQWHSVILVILGCAMMIVGGNRSTIAAAMVAIPVILILRRSTHVLAFAGVLVVVGILMLRFSVSEMTSRQVSPLVRSLGIFDSKIDESSGGDSSADWRYQVWQSGIEKIMQHPVIGKGFGNLPKRLDTDAMNMAESTDFEVILAGGEAHNGFVTAAYGFGIPFMAALSIGLIVRFVSQVTSALRVDRHDLELRDLYALIASMYPAYIVNIYAAFDLSVTGLWVYVSLGFILNNLPRTSAVVDTAPVLQPQMQSLPTGYAYASGAKFTAKRK